jgi:hypothetical protein
MKTLNYQEAPEKNMIKCVTGSESRTETFWQSVWFYLMSNYFELIPSRENDQSQQISLRNNNWK